MNSNTRKSYSWVAKSNHSQIIKDDYIQNFLESCRFPSKPNLDGDKFESLIEKLSFTDIENKHILTVDGSYTLVQSQKQFPSSEIAFFQFGAIVFETDDLKNLSSKPFISPADMNKLHNLNKIKLALPVKNVTSSNQISLNSSIRKEIYLFFTKEGSENFSLMKTLYWILFEEYADNPIETYSLGNDPNNSVTKDKVILNKHNMKSDFTFEHNGQVIYLTDVFRLHEVIDEDFGARGILGYVSRLIEQMLLMRYIHIIYRQAREALKDFVFISNGPLSFSGQTANMHKAFRKICSFLQNEINLCLMGLEKTGPFIDHATEICKNEESKFYLEKGNILILSNEYIYKYITPGDHKIMHYGETSYYGGKVIIHTDDGQVFVVSVPIADKSMTLYPKMSDYINIELVASILKRLKCDMYSDTVIPVAIANKLINLNGQLGHSILDKFASKYS